MAKGLYLTCKNQSKDGIDAHKQSKQQVQKRTGRILEHQVMLMASLLSTEHQDVLTLGNSRSFCSDLQTGTVLSKTASPKWPLKLSAIEAELQAQ